MTATTLILPNGLQVKVAPCRNCGRLLPIAAYGRCRACYEFFHRHGHDRPPESINPGKPVVSPRRTCECGQPACHEKIVRIGKDPHFKYTMIYLCDDCLKLELQK